MKKLLSKLQVLVALVTLEKSWFCKTFSLSIIFCNSNTNVITKPDSIEVFFVKVLTTYEGKLISLILLSFSLIIVVMG